MMISEPFNPRATHRSMRTILVEGCRLIPHSYAMVNQYLCLELLKRPDVRLYHRDVPFYSPQWTRMPGLWAPEDEARIAGIPAPPADLRPDVVLRMGFPHFLDADPAARRTFCWGTSEFGLIEAAAIGDGRTPQAALSAATARIVACSNWAAMGFINSGARKDNVSVVPCGADPGIFKPATAEARLALRREFGWEDKFILLNIGGMWRNKGVFLAMEAVAGLIDRHPHLHLMLKGSDALYSSAQHVQAYFGDLPQAQAAKLVPHLGYTGDIYSQSHIAALYQAADAYLSPYRAEGFNLPVLEAAACGLPVICTRGGTTDDFVDDSFTLRVDATPAIDDERRVTLEPDREQLARHIERIIADAAFREHARAAGPEWVRSKFTWQHTVDRLLALMFAGDQP
jgi:glycosyltransferase involved in cell wall biosynthesis